MCQKHNKSGASWTLVSSYSSTLLHLRLNKWLLSLVIGRSKIFIQFSTFCKLLKLYFLVLLACSLLLLQRCFIFIVWVASVLQYFNFASSVSGSLWECRQWVRELCRALIACKLWEGSSYRCLNVELCRDPLSCNRFKSWDSQPCYYFSHKKLHGAPLRKQVIDLWQIVVASNQI